MKQLWLFALAAIAITGLVIWSPWTDHTPSQDMTNELRRQAQVAAQEMVIDSLQAKIHDDSVAGAHSTAKAIARTQSLGARVAALKPEPIPVDTMGDTTAMVLVHRNTDQVWQVPKFVLDVVVDQQAALQQDTLDLQKKDQEIADQRAMIFMQTQRITSADSTIAVRDQRIHQLNKRRWQDYIAVGCGYGIKGADCIVGGRIPF